MPKIAVDGGQHVWVIWSRRTGDNWDLVARALDGNHWLAPIRLTTDPGPDINPALITDLAGNLWLAWQGFRLTITTWDLEFPAMEISRGYLYASLPIAACLRQ
jgi:hypothetical protein